MKFVKRFALITIVLLLGSGFYVWLLRFREVPTLSYVPDPDWSRSYVIIPDLDAETFRAGVDLQENVHTVWLHYAPDGQTVDLLHMSVDPRGKVVVAPHVVTTAGDIADYHLTVAQDSLRILWVGTGDGEHMDLNYLEVNPAGERVDERLVLSDYFADVNSLNAVPVDGGLLVTWAAPVNRVSSIQTLVLDDSGLAKSPPKVLALNPDCICPKLATDSQKRIHLNWQEEQEGGYGIYYGQLTAAGDLKTESVFIGVTQMNSVAMAATDEKVFLAWVQRLPKIPRRDESIVEKAFPNDVIFGTTLDADDPVQPEEITQLTDSIGPAFEPNLAADRERQMNLVYIDTYGDTLGLTQQRFGSDFADIRKASRRLYPDQRVVLQTRLLPDPVQGLHILWMKIDMYDGAMYYANTLHPQWISPLQVIGCNRERKGNAIMSFLYPLGMSFYSMFIHLHYLIIAMLAGGLTGLIYLLRNTKWGSLLGHRFIAPIILCLTTILLYLIPGKQIGVAEWLMWPKLFCPDQVWFITLLATAGTVFYIVKGKIRNHDLLKLTIAVIFWFFWVNMLNFIFHLQVVNFT